MHYWAEFVFDHTDGHIGPGGGEGPGGGVLHNSSPGDEVWLLVVAVSLVAVSFFLLHEGKKFQRWATRRSEEREETSDTADSGAGGMRGTLSRMSAQDETGSAPDPNSGGFRATAVFGLAISLAFFYLVYFGPSVIAEGPFETIFKRLMVEPRTYFSIAVGASFAPAAMGLFKFSIAYFLLREFPRDDKMGRRSPQAAASGAILTAVYLAGAVASLVSVIT